MEGLPAQPQFSILYRMNITTDDLINFDKCNLNNLADDVLIEIASAARANRYVNCGHNLGALIRNLAKKCDYVRRRRVYETAGEMTGSPMYSSQYIEAGICAVRAAGFTN